MKDAVWSECALADADKLFAYIAADNPGAASKVLDRIEKTAQFLGRVATGRRGRVEGTYEKSMTGLPYVIAYGINHLPNGSEQIVILHIIHTARDWPKGGWPK